MPATSSTPVSPSITQADQQAIAAVPARMVEVWAKHDADGFADLFTPDGTLILPGHFLTGREEIREFMAAGFASRYRGTRVTGQPIQFKPLGQDAAALITMGGVLAPDADALADADAIRASWILVRRDRRWELAVYQNCPRDPGQ